LERVSGIGFPETSTPEDWIPACAGMTVSTHLKRTHKFIMKPTERFSNRAATYDQFRPSYPLELLDYLRDAWGVKGEMVVADVGSGTGLLTRLFLENGNVTYAVEPNGEMRAVADRLLGDYANYVSVGGSAEKTTLPTNSIDLITAGTAFHWFDDDARAEFQRILQPDGVLALIWNKRRSAADPFMIAYKNVLLEHVGQHCNTQFDKIKTRIDSWFGGQSETAQFDNVQLFDLEGFLGRVFTSSYTPLAESAEYDAFVTDLHTLFDAYAENGVVKFSYDTVVFIGRI